MPNILIVGFHSRIAEEIRGAIEGILKEIGKAEDAITTIVPASTKWCSKPGDAPYLVVRNTDLDEAALIASVLRVRMDIDVEYEKIAGFLASVASG